MSGRGSPLNHPGAAGREIKIVRAKRLAMNTRLTAFTTKALLIALPHETPGSPGFREKPLKTSGFSPFRAWRRCNRRGRFEPIAGGILPAPRQAFNAITTNALLIAPNPRCIGA